jgi:hypothetical protein
MAGITLAGWRFIARCSCCKGQGVDMLKRADGGDWKVLINVPETILRKIAFVLCCDNCREENGVKF